MTIEAPDFRENSDAESAPVETANPSQGHAHWQFTKAMEESPDWFKEIDWFDLKNEPSAKRIKHNDIRDVFRVKAGSRLFYAKHLHTRGVIDALRRFIGRHPALREWQASQYAKWNRLNAVEYVAWGRRLSRVANQPKGHVLISQAFDAQNLNQEWPRISQSYERMVRSTKSLVELFSAAHEHAFLHGDPHPENILIADDLSTAWFIDLQRSRYGRDLSRLARARDLVKLNQWFRHRATRTQRLRFLTQYLHRINELNRIRHWTAMLEQEAKRHNEYLAKKRDARIWGYNRYFQSTKLAGGWHAHIVVRYRRQSCDREIVEQPADIMVETLNAVISGADPPAPLIARRAQTRRFSAKGLRGDFKQLCCARHRDQSADQPHAFLYRNHGSRRDEVLITEPVVECTPEGAILP
jgi:hypothetical protein